MSQSMGHVPCYTFCCQILTSQLNEAWNAWNSCEKKQQSNGEREKKNKSNSLELRLR